LALDDDRWVAVSPSPFQHEAEGLEIVRKLLPNTEPYRAWSNFEFRDGNGQWHEVDLLVFAQDALHLVELKYYTGILRGNNHRWERGGRSEDNPLLLARRKAQYLASQLSNELDRWAREVNIRVPDRREAVPFVKESVFLHHPRVVCELDDEAAIGLYGLDGHRHHTNLPGVSELLLAPASGGRATTATQARIVPILMERLGLKPNNERTIGSWSLKRPLDTLDEKFQDWHAEHTLIPANTARIRFRTVPPGAPQRERTQADELSKHEYSTMSALTHDGLLTPLEVHDSDLGIGLVYPHSEFERLDLWLNDARPNLETTLSVIRQVAEAVNYAHGKGVAHRALRPESIWVRRSADGSPKVLVGDWHFAGQTDSDATGVTTLAQSTPEAGDNIYTVGEDAWTVQDSERFRLDVFSLGAISAFLLTGKPPAPDRNSLNERLRSQEGIDISVDLPSAAEALRELVLHATRPRLSERTPSLSDFITHLSSAEALLDVPDEPETDPLDALPGTLLAGRFRLRRRLGSGSTAVGLLVTDESQKNAPERVLKVAINDDAARRLEQEAAVLAKITKIGSPRLVQLLEGPIDVVGRRTIVLEPAGEETLADVLRDRERLSLDLLQRFGTDLLEALTELDSAGYDHRHIKPANLGVRENRSNRRDHLVLFDFSQARVAASAIESGTAPYLDPFLGETGRGHYDSAAERYAAAVVLYEMATGQAPVYGEPGVDPRTIDDDVTVTASAFDRSISRAMARFFRKALARDAASRHLTATEMLRDWQRAFPSSLTEVTDDAEKLVAAATPTTVLTKSGLTARALSAIEPLGVKTVAELAAVEPGKLTSLSGSAHTTKQEVSKRAKFWREKFNIEPARPSLASPLEDLAEQFINRVGRSSAEQRRTLARLILGLPVEHVPAFATNTQLAAHMEGTSPGRINELFSGMHREWGNAATTRTWLARLDNEVMQRLNDLGGIATTTELAGTVLHSIQPAPPASTQERESFQRTAEGILRIVLDRRVVVLQAEEPLHFRRREGKPLLVATHQELLDAAEPLGEAADELIGSDPSALIPADVAGPHLQRILTRVLGRSSAHGRLCEPGRLVELAAGLSTAAAASGRAELHHRSIDQATAVRLTFQNASANQEFTPAAIARRVAVRFPSLPPLPTDKTLQDPLSPLGFRYDQERKVYRHASSPRATTGLTTRQDTRVHIEAAPPVAEVLESRLRDSTRSRSFLALGIPGHRLLRGINVLTEEFNATTVNVTEVLLGELRKSATKHKMDWSIIESADAAPPASTAGRGLAKFVADSTPAIVEAVEDAMEAGSPVLLTDAGPLARYGHLNLLTQWTDLTRPRHQAVWLVVPQIGRSHGPRLDGEPLALNSPSQFLTLDSEWIDTRSHLLPTGVDA